MKENGKSMNFITFYNIQSQKGSCSRYKMKENGKSMILFIFDNIQLAKGACSRYKMKEKQYINSWEAGGGTGTR